MSEEVDRKTHIWVNEFEEKDVRRFYLEFQEMEADPSVAAITIFIDSYGGSVNGYLAMRDLIKSTDKPVATVCVGKAMSAGAFLLACGNKGLRFISKDADIMVHELSSGFWGKNQELQSVSKYLERMNKKILRNFAEDTGTSLKDIENQLHKVKNADWYLSSREAKKWGLVDHIEIPRLMNTNPATVLVSIQKKAQKNAQKKG